MHGPVYASPDTLVSPAMNVRRTEAS